MKTSQPEWRDIKYVKIICSCYIIKQYFTKFGMIQFVTWLFIDIHLLMKKSKAKVSYI
jgi:hypothetical protein